MNINIPAFSKARILVIGDVMLDRYLYGAAERISPEAPVPIVKIEKEEERPGGAGNVALNIAALGAQTTLLGLTGDDIFAKRLKEYLTGANIYCDFKHIEGMPTTVKLRILSQHQQLLRLDFEKKPEEFSSQELLRRFKKRLENTDVVVLSDYSKGALSRSHEFIEIANKRSIPVFVDPKHKDFSVYQGASLITPNFKEFLAASGGLPCDDEKELGIRARQLLKEHNIQHLLLTRGEQGMTLFHGEDCELHIPARAREVFDVTGAGDTVIAVMAVAVAAGMDLAKAMKLANIAAGIAVGKLGSAIISVPELRRAAQSAHLGGVLNEEQLLLAVADARADGKTVVMTNGCFDILHAGHVTYLEQAKALGDKLIVAVNDDNSVKRLKGSGRPINSIDKRMAVLAGLNAVDWIISFTEDTPKRLISSILPDILVKGGNWQPEQIAGAEDVLNNGGQVKTLNFIEGCSTTSLIEQINGKEGE